MEAGSPVMEGHLGGYLPGGDPATYFPALWEFLVDEHGVRSVIDVGCGDGVALNHFRWRGCRVLGVEGVPQDEPDIVAHDYTTGPYYAPVRKAWDLCWCCEFVEHVEEQYVPNFLATFACAELVLMTHATPGQPGYHHVNCQDRQYWVDRLFDIGYDIDEQFTVDCRIVAADNRHSWNHFVRSGLAFRRRD